MAETSRSITHLIVYPGETGNARELTKTKCLFQRRYSVHAEPVRIEEFTHRKRNNVLEFAHDLVPVFGIVTRLPLINSDAFRLLINFLMHASPVDAPGISTRSWVNYLTNFN